MSSSNLILVLGDQLNQQRGALADAVPGRDTVVMAEVQTEARYVPHNRHKIAFVFSAMRHFCQHLRDSGFTVIYYRYEDGLTDLRLAVESALAETTAGLVRVTEPGEYRLQQAMTSWELPAPIELVADDGFLASRSDFSTWALQRRQPRMEHFYRTMRKRYKILLDSDGAPEGGQWNYDASNRSGWRSQQGVPERPFPKPDAITREVLQLVGGLFPDNPGDLTRFYLGVTQTEAEAQLDWFISHGLADFGTYQDALAEESPWLFHSLVSMYLNVGLLSPLDVCRRAEMAYRAGHCSLPAAEGFVRQILGWREYVRGIYWWAGEQYSERNALNATHPLPEWFWDGKTNMRCLSQALQQSLELGYAHHIQRLMVIGNFALLCGLDVESVCQWYLSVYVDAFEWVELPNTLGMALYADGGLMASKPYIASGKYIQRQGDHCRHCPFSPSVMTGEKACPYNSLYWRFVDKHQSLLKKNARMALTLRNWDRKPASDRAQIVAWADHLLAHLDPA